MREADHYTNKTNLSVKNLHNHLARLIDKQ